MLSKSSLMTVLSRMSEFLVALTILSKAWTLAGDMRLESLTASFDSLNESFIDEARWCIKCGNRRTCMICLRVRVTPTQHCISSVHNVCSHCIPSLPRIGACHFSSIACWRPPLRGFRCLPWVRPTSVRRILAVVDASHQLFLFDKLIITASSLLLFGGNSHSSSSGNYRMPTFLLTHTLSSST